MLLFWDDVWNDYAITWIDQLPAARAVIATSRIASVALCTSFDRVVKISPLSADETKKLMLLYEPELHNLPAAHAVACLPMPRSGRRWRLCPAGCV